MKKILLSMLMVASATSIMAQNHGAMQFAGNANFYVSIMGNPTGNTEVESDTVVFAMNNASSGKITLPKMIYSASMTIPSFTIDSVGFSFDYSTMTTTFTDQTFSTTAEVDGEEKQITGSSITGTFQHTNNVLDITVTFTYGVIPFPLTYHITGYYVKSYTDNLDVVVGGSFKYFANEQVTYKVRTYVENDSTKLDVEVPQYVLENTVMGNLTIGSYTVRGLVYDDTKGGYYRDYAANDTLTMYFSNGASLNGDYKFTEGNLLVTLDGHNVQNIVNTFKPGAMPFPIVSTFPGTFATKITEVKESEPAVKNNGAAYNLAGQRVPANTKGIVIINGKKYLNK